MTERRDPPWDDQPLAPDTEQLLAEWFEDEAPSREPAVLAPNVIARTALTRRRSRWFVADWWRDLFRLHRRPALVPSLAAAAAAAILVVVSLARPGGLLGDGEQSPAFDIPAQAITVSPDDERSSETIAEAIAAAEPGDEIYLLPGQYTENLVLDKDVDLIGAGSVDEIVLRPATLDAPIILIDVALGAEPRLAGFTVEGPGSISVVATSPLITGMVFRDVGDQWWTYTGGGWNRFDAAKPSIEVDLLAHPTIDANTFIGGGEVRITGGSDATITRNELRDGAAIFLEATGDETVVRGNTITDSGRYSIESSSCAELVIEGNTITQSDPGIAIAARCLVGTIRDNTISGANVGIQLEARSAPRIINNVVDTNGVALEVHAEAEATLTDNELCGTNAIMAVMRGATPLDLSDNTLCEGAPLIFE